MTHGTHNVKSKNICILYSNDGVNVLLCSWQFSVEFHICSEAFCLLDYMHTYHIVLQSKIK